MYRNMERRCPSTSFHDKLRVFEKECSIEDKLIVKRQSSVLQSLFGKLREPKPEISSFVEMYRSVFRTGRATGGFGSVSNPGDDPDVTTNGTASSSSSSSCSSTVTVKAWLDKYRAVMHNCLNYKSHSFHVFVSEEDLGNAHSTGVGKVLSWLQSEREREESQESVNNNFVAEDGIKSALKKEYGWIRAVNNERFKNHVSHSFNEELRHGRDCLENNFNFKIIMVTNGGGGSGEQAGPRHEMQELKGQIDAEIERRVESFAKMFPEVSSGDYEATNCIRNAAVRLRSQLEEIRSRVKDKNEGVLAKFVDSFLTQLVLEYQEQMSLFLSAKSLTEEDVTEIDEKHEQLKAESFAKWKSKVSSLDRDYPTSQHLVKMEAMLETILRQLWTGKRESVLEACLADWRRMNLKARIMHIMVEHGVPVSVDPVRNDDDDDPFCADLSAALNQIEARLKEQVEAVQIGSTRRTEEDGRVSGCETVTHTTTGTADDDIQRGVPPTRNETPEAEPVPSTSSSSSIILSRPAYRWELVPIPNHEHLVPKSTPARGRKRKIDGPSISSESLRTFGIGITNDGGIRAAITIDHVPHVLTETSADGREKSTIIPLLVGLTSTSADSPNEFVFGNAVKRLQQQQLLWHFDVAQLFRSEHTHLSHPQLTVELRGEQVTFQLELLVGKIFQHVKTLMEAALKERFGGKNITSLGKFLISVPPHFRGFQVLQITDATFIIGLKNRFVAPFCEPTLLAFDFFRQDLESQESSGRNNNILVISQYSDYILLNLFGFKRCQTTLTISPIRDYPAVKLPTTTQHLDVEEDSRRFSENLKRVLQDCSTQLSFVGLRTEHESYFGLIRSALASAQLPTSIRVFPMDELASARGLTSVGDYGYWQVQWGKQRVDLSQDKFIRYKGDRTVEWAAGNLSDDQVDECCRLFRKLVKPVVNYSSDEDSEQAPTSKKTRQGN